MLKRLMLSVAVTGIILSGCTSTPSAVQPTPSVPNVKSTSTAQDSSSLLYKHHWIATEINGFQIPSETDSAQIPSIQFDSAAQRFSGTDGCNQIMGSFHSDATSLQFGQVASTKMMCLDAKNVTAAQYQQILSKVASYRASDQLLVLFDANGQTLAAYRAIAAS